MPYYGTALTLFGLPLITKPHHPESKNDIAILLATNMLFTSIFFTFYYTTTWRGRYFLPIAIPWTILSATAWTKHPCRFLRNSALTAILLLNLAVFSQLYRHAGTPVWRIFSQQEKNEAIFLKKLPAGTRVMAQEVQGALFMPELVFISTDGLIEGSAYKAYLNNETVWDFWIREKPDFILPDKYYLNDPHQAAKALNEAFVNNLDSFKINGVPFQKHGLIRGTGTLFKPDWSYLTKTNSTPSQNL